MQAIRNASNASIMFCAGAFVLLMATATSNYLIRVATIDVANWPEFLGQFMLPAIPLAVAIVLLAARNHAAATLVAGAGTALSLGLWAMVGL